MHRFKSIENELVLFGPLRLIAAPLAFFVAYMPLVGTVVGMFGAVTAWHWSWLQAGGLFFSPFIAILIMAMLSRRNGEP